MRSGIATALKAESAARLYLMCYKSRLADIRSADTDTNQPLGLVSS